MQHFLVDGLCISCMFLLADAYSEYCRADGDRVGLRAILTYNVLAFMSQPLTGMLADRMIHRHWLLIWSSLLLTLAVACASLLSSQMTMGIGSEWPLMLVAVLLGAGNSLFHVWGGKLAVMKTGNDIRALGVFVSTGALGLAVGLVFRSWALVCGLLLAIVALAVTYVRCDDGASLPVKDIKEHSNWFTPVRIWTLVIGLMLFVGYRSYAGELFSKNITKTQELVLMIGTVAMLGKITGGWMARWMGILKSLMVILVGVGLCFFMRTNLNLVLLLGIFLMNCTMPITLYLANLLLPKSEGLAFGLLAAALIPGYLLAVYL